MRRTKGNYKAGKLLNKLEINNLITKNFCPKKNETL